MKLVSWNVNGIRACIKKGFMDYFEAKKADFYCLQEIKLSEGQLDEKFSPYYCYYNYAEKKGYSGTAIFAKEKPINVIYGDDNEGRVIVLEYEKFYLVNVYTPNSKAELLRLEYRMQWDKEFSDLLKSLDEKKIVLFCGDLNVAHEEIDIKNPKANARNAGFTIEERNGFSSLLKKGFIDSFRYLHPDKVTYSWWSYRFKARERNAGWRLDYWGVSERAKDKIIESSIETEVTGSDHCPVVLDIDL